MVTIPIPVPRLCLSLEFDIEKSGERPSNDRHDAAIKEAARVVDGFISFSKYGVTPDAFIAKVIDGNDVDPDRQLSFNAVHNAPFDPSFHVASGGPAIRYEFVYSDKHPNDSPEIPSKLFLRIVTSFGKPEETIDGVLATRIGLTAMEILQGNEIHPTIFPKHPPVPFGMRQVFNFFHHNILNGVLAIPIGYLQLYLFSLLEKLGLKKEDNLFRVNNTVLLLKFHASKHSLDSATYHIYRSDSPKNAFKAFLSVAEKWTKRLGLDGYFYLLNVSPMAAPSITYNIQDISKIEARYRGAFAPTGPPPGADLWPIINIALASKIVVNNYGVHKHNFSAKPVSFLWDWLHVRNTTNAAVCITINGVFISCFRGLEQSFALLDIPVETFPNPPTKATANTAWNKIMKEK